MTRSRRTTDLFMCHTRIQFNPTKMMHNYVMSLVISMQNVLIMLKNKAIRGLNDSWVF